MKKFFAIFFVMMCVTITSFAGDLLTAAMFRSWTTSGADAVDNGAAGCNYKINDQSASDGLPYGDGNVYYLNFADLSAYSTMEIEFTEGTPRLLFNRLVDQGTVGVEINGSAGMEYVDATTAGKWIVDIAAITEAQGFAHLHCIKGANWANATVTRVELFKAAAPVNPLNMLKGDAFNFEGGTTGNWGAWGELAGTSGVVSPGFESDYCFKAVTTATGDNWKAQAGYTFPAALDPSVEYTLKFMAKGSGTVQMFYQSSDYANQDYKSMFTLTDEWQEFTEKYTPGYDNIVRILFSFGQCTELYVDNIEFAPASAPAPAVDPVKVESYVGDSYEGIPAGIEGDLAKAVADYLGVAAGEEVAMATYDEAGNLVEANNGRGETDGWRNAEGAFVGWGTEGFTYYVQPYAELDEEGNWYFGAYVGSAPGAVNEPIDFTEKVKFSANGKSVEFPVTLSYIERPALDVEVQEEVDVPEFTYDFTLGYAGGEGTFDISGVKDAIGCTAAEAEVFGFNPSTEEAVRGAMATFGGWHAANGDLQGWGEAPFCIKFYNNGTFWYCAMPDVAELGATYKTAWLLVNPKTGDAVQYNFTMTDDVAARKPVPNDQVLTVDFYKDYTKNPEGDAFATELNLNVDTRTVYGNKSIYAERYADLSDWNYMTVVYSKGTPQFIFNRQGVEDTSAEYLDILPTDETYVSYSDGNFYIINLAKIVEDFGYAHLNIIRGDKFVETNVSKLKLYHNDPAPGRFEDADYYLYNEEADAWLVGGNSWGTQASLGKHGMPVKFVYRYGDYAIDSYTYNNANDHFLGDATFFVDQPAADWTITEIDGSYYFSASGTFMTSDGTTVLVRNAERTDAAKWQVYTKADLEAKMLDPEDPFVDATFYAQVPNFSRNQAYPAQGKSPWTAEANNKNLSGGNNINNNAESWRSSNGFNVHQTITNLPTGLYRIDVQGAVCEYADPKNGQDLAVAYANYMTTPFVVSKLANRQDGNENSMSEMSESFTAGKYQLEPMYVAVTDGTLTIGVKSPRTDTWAVWDNFELTYMGEDIIEEGEYYLYNAEADAWLGGGNSWGTHATMIKHGMPVYVGEHKGGNVYTINTYTYNNANDHYLGWDGGGSGFFVDAPGQGLAFEKVGDAANEYIICANGSYIGTTADAAAFEGAPVDLMPTTDAAQAAHWILVTRAERAAAFAEATFEKPVDATFLIEVPNFSRNQAYPAQGKSPWTAEAANKNLSGGNNSNNCAESWNSSNGFNVYQTLTNLPNGMYRLCAQASVCDYAGTFEDLAVIYANEKTRQFNSSSRWSEGVQENGENSMSAMSESFSAGKYAIKPILVLVEDGTLTVGAKTARTDTWAVWDNFELYYLGADIDTLHVGPFYKMVASDNVVIDYPESAGSVAYGTSSKNYLDALHATSTDELVLFAVDTNSGLTFEPYSWVNFTGYYDENGSVSGIANAAVKANVRFTGSNVYVEVSSLEETVDPRYHAYAVVANPAENKAILVDIEVNFVDRPDYVATSIDTVKANEGDAKIFDLSGREVKKATKGVYIINGVKTFVK